MKLSLIFLSVILISCSAKVEFNQELADELSALAKVDQTAGWLPLGKFIEYSRQEWENYKDSVFGANKVRAEEIFNEQGYPGFELVGEQGSRNYWLLVQHCDFDPNFQERVLVGMKEEIEKNNANKSNYAFLSDRVNINLGKPILYGTQVSYNGSGQAVVNNLQDSANVNIRRAEVGLEPLEVYLNRMTESHFEMNRENFLSRGITEPMLYPVSEE